MVVSMEVGFNFGSTLPPSDKIKTVSVPTKRLPPNSELRLPEYQTQSQFWAFLCRVGHLGERLS